MGTHFIHALNALIVLSNLSFRFSLFLNSKMENLSMFKKVFDFVDKDNDFKISSSDLSKTIKQVSGLTLLDEEVDELMSRFPHGSKSTIGFEEVSAVLKEKITESLNEQEINLTYETCINKCEKTSSKEIRWRNEEKLERKLSLKGLKNAIQYLIGGDDKISVEELMSAASMIRKSNVKDTMSKSEFSEMVSEISKNPFICFSAILFDLCSCLTCILRRIYIFAKLSTILNPPDMERTIDHEFKNLAIS